MPFSVALHASPRLATLRFAGPTTSQCVREACNRLLDMPDWRPGTPQVWDFTSISRLDVDPDGWAALLVGSREKQERIGANRVAVVSHHEDLDAFLDLYARASRPTGRTFQLVRSAEDARDWVEGLATSSRTV